ncbi:MAG: hypothetical protein AAGF24_15690 [Cyanobacteria bacterium P01_H01_bin.121]
MTVVVKSFAPHRSPQADAAPRLPFAESALKILGAGHDLSWLTAPLTTAADTLFNPRGACLFSPTGPLWIADTGHHRLLGWRSLPMTDGQPADWVIGQPDFEQEGPNAKGETTAISVATPTGICACGAGMAVADAWNHRVLIWHQVPTASHVPADLVLGQIDFNQHEPNRGDLEPQADRLHWPYGVLFQDGKLYVADTGNRRVLVWNGIPQVNGQPADQVLGQATFTTRHENGGGTASASSMRWPHSLAIWHGNLVVGDAGNNRLMVWQGIPAEDNASCSAILGQPDVQSVELNRGDYFPSDRSLNMPYGVATAGDWLLVADTTNSRLLGWCRSQQALEVELQQGRLQHDTLQDAPADGLLLGDAHVHGLNSVYNVMLQLLL